MRRSSNRIVPTLQCGIYEIECYIFMQAVALFTHPQTLSSRFLEYQSFKELKYRVGGHSSPREILLISVLVHPRFRSRHRNKHFTYDMYGISGILCLEEFDCWDCARLHLIWLQFYSARMFQPTQRSANQHMSTTGTACRFVLGSCGLKGVCRNYLSSQCHAIQ